jgi:hypothetical protein
MNGWTEQLPGRPSPHMRQVLIGIFLVGLSAAFFGYQGDHLSINQRRLRKNALMRMALGLSLVCAVPTLEHHDQKNRATSLGSRTRA